MKRITLYSLFALMSLSLVTKASVYPVIEKVTLKETPAKTICIKNAMAADANKYFSTTTSFYFEIYKPGSKADLVAIIDKFKATEGVENCTPGNVTGDYYAITLTLKSTKDKAWFAKTVKVAGLGHIKINNNEAVEVEKM